MILEALFSMTLFITGGRKDKISKGDIAGLFCKQGKLNNDFESNTKVLNKQDQNGLERSAN